MKKKVLISVVSLLSLLSGCRPKTDTANKEEKKPVEITDIYGRKNTIEDASRPVCIGAGALRLYSYIGDVNKLAGVEAIEKQDKVFNGIIRPYRELHKDVFSKLPSCGEGGPKHQNAEPEAILACKPSVVISEYTDVESMNELEKQLGVPVVMVSYGKALGVDTKISESLTLLGKIFGQEEKAKTLTDYIASMKTDLDNRTKDVKEEDKKSVYLGCLGNYGVQDIYSTSYNFSLMNLSHIKNAVDDPNDPKTGYTFIDKEAFQKMDIDRLVLDGAGIRKFKTTYEANPELFDNLKPFKTGEVYLEMPFNAYFTNIEIAYMDAYYLGKVAYPEQFADVDMAVKSNEITKAFLGEEYYSKIQEFHQGGFQKIENIKEFFQNL